MSRWQDSFQSHAFRVAFSRLLVSVGEAKPSEQATASAVMELARLKKAVSFVEEMIGSVDPELMPLALWDSFQGQAEACLQQVDAFRSSGADGHINNANSCADGLIATLRPYPVAKGKHGPVFQNAALSFARTVEEFASAVVNSRNEATGEILRLSEAARLAAAAAAESQAVVLEARQRIVGNDEGGVLPEMEQLLTDSQSKVGAINQHYDEIFVGTESEVATKDSVLDAKKDIDKAKKEVDAANLSVAETTAALGSFFVKVFGSADAEGKLTGGLSDQFKNRVTALTEFEKTGASPDRVGQLPWIASGYSLSPPRWK